MRRTFPILMAAALGWIVNAWAADVAILGGDVSLNITTAVAGEQPLPVSDETGRLEWTTLESDPVKKITAQTSLASPSFTLKVQAVSVSAGDGTSAGQVTLSTSPSDLITDIPANIPAMDPGTCTLRYTASATAAGGAGQDVHTITFTIMDQ